MCNFKLLGLCLVVFSLSIITEVQSEPTGGCLRCICGVESNGNQPGCGVVQGDAQCGKGCIMDEGSCSCGPYQIKDVYFKDCSEKTSLPINDWRGCALNEDCAKKCTIAYLNRYGTYCTNKADSAITCDEYGGIHNRGPSGCYAAASAGYREKIKTCCRQVGYAACGYRTEL